jgi:cytoskeleton protein RodZ
MDKQIPDTQMSLGEFLRSEREKKHITLEQIASATKINVKTLNALEHDNYESLPAKPFIRGFVNSYTRYIGLDSKFVLEKYESFLSDKSSKKFKRPEDAPHIFVEKNTSTENNKTALSVMLIGSLVVGAILFAILKPSLKHKRGRHKEKEEVQEVATETLVAPQAIAEPPAEKVPNAVIPTSTQSESSAKASEPVKAKATPVVVVTTPAPKPTPLAKETPTPKPTPTPASTTAATTTKNSIPSIPMSEVKHMLVVRSIEDSWVHYQADDRPEQAFTLKQGKTIFIRARNSIRFTSGKIKSLEFSFDNKTFKPYPNNVKVYVVPSSLESEFKEKPFVPVNPTYLSTGNP